MVVLDLWVHLEMVWVSERREVRGSGGLLLLQSEAICNWMTAILEFLEITRAELGMGLQRWGWMEVLELVAGGTVDVWFGYFPSRLLLGVLDRGKLFGMKTSESEEGFCRIMLMSLAGGALGVAGGGIRTRGICFESSEPRHCGRIM